MHAATGASQTPADESQVQRVPLAADLAMAYATSARLVREPDVERPAAPGRTRDAEGSDQGAPRRRSGGIRARTLAASAQCDLGLELMPVVRRSTGRAEGVGRQGLEP